MAEVKIVNGFISDGENMGAAKVVVRFSSDSRGETISLQVSDIMIGAAFEDVKPVIEKAKKKKR